MSEIIIRKQALQKRNWALAYARENAYRKNVTMVQAWLDRAASYYMLSDMQVWKLKEILGSTRFNKLDFSKILVVDTAKIREEYDRLSSK